MDTSGLHLDALKTHFASKGFGVETSVDKDGRINTLLLSMRGSVVIALKVDTRDGTIDAGHLREMVARYSSGLPLMDPHTRRPMT